MRNPKREALLDRMEAIADKDGPRCDQCKQVIVTDDDDAEYQRLKGLVQEMDKAVTEKQPDPTALRPAGTPALPTQRAQTRNASAGALLGAVALAAGERGVDTGVNVG